MRLDDVDERGSVEDRRGSKKKLALGGGIGALLIAVVASYLGLDPEMAKKIGGMFGGGGGQQVVGDGDGTPPKDDWKDFSEKVLGSTNGVWDEQFRVHYPNKKYKHPELVLFSNEVDSEGCGVAPSAVGPFYCPKSKKLFFDPAFFDELSTKLEGDSGNFTKAYVIAHEVGHHVQNQLGYNEMVEDFRRKEGPNGGARLELQADYLAGVWAHHAQKKYKIIESEKDINSALKTAKAIGDDKLAKLGSGGKGGWVDTKKFTHGLAEQRAKHFLEGFKSGKADRESLMYFFNEKVKPLDL